ncbi:MAG: hypothetical protein ABIW79_11180, partial [Gemmatimonas sp.]
GKLGADRIGLTDLEPRISLRLLETERDGCSIENSTVGPNVSLGAGSRVRDSRITDAVVGEKTTIMDSTLHHAFIGDSVTVQGLNGSLTVGDHSEILGNT